MATPVRHVPVLSEANGWGAGGYQGYYRETSLTRLALRDGLGHVRGLMSTSKTITDRYVYDAYGNDVAPNLHNTTEGNALRFRWNGSYPDSFGTGGYRTLYLLTGQQTTNTATVTHVGARHYSPQIRRFLQLDPGGLSGGDPNIYQFAGNQPVTRYDIGGYEVSDKGVWEWLSDWWKSGEMGRAIPILGGLAEDAGEAVGRYDCGQAAFLEAAGKTALLLGAIGLSAVAIEQTGAAALRAPKSLPNVMRAPKSPYEIAKAGGKHAGHLRNYATRTVSELRNAIRGYRKVIDLHRKWISNPRLKVPTWDQLSAKQKCDLIAKWKSDIARNEELMRVIEGLLKQMLGGS